jgi:hypothetical protein
VLNPIWTFWRRRAHRALALLGGAIILAATFFKTRSICAPAKCARAGFRRRAH